MQSLYESRGGSKVTKPNFSNSIKRYFGWMDFATWFSSDVKKMGIPNRKDY